MQVSGELSRRGFLGGVAAVGVGALLSRTAMAAGSEYQIGCYTRPWAQYDWIEAFDAIAEAGFKYVGLMTTKAPRKTVISMNITLDESHQIAEEAKKRGLSIPSAWGGGLPLKSEAEAIEGMRKLIDNCAAAGVANVLMGGVGNDAQAAVYYKAIKECCDYAVAKKVQISVKPHGGTNSTGPQCRKLVEQVGHKNFGLWYDPGNMFHYSKGAINPVDDVETVSGVVMGMCVKDWDPEKSVNITPGTGKVDFKTVLTKLKKGGFASGALVVECLAPGDKAATLAEAKKARAFIEQVVAGL